jgi:hypothetical protein
MGAILEVVNLMSSPVGMVVTAVVAISAFYFMRWVLKD